MQPNQLQVNVLVTALLGGLLAAQSPVPTDHPVPAADRIHAEAYGAASGSAPNDLRIALRKEGARSIELTGGTPGNIAALLIGTPTLPAAQLHGALQLVNPSVAPVLGRFDADGVFAWHTTLAEIPAGDSLYFQGMQTDGCGSVHQMTARLKVIVLAEAPVDEFDLTRAHLPGIAIVTVAGRVCDLDLQGAFEAMLNSKGDSVDVEIKGDFSMPLPPPVSMLSIGGKFALEVEVKRDEDDATKSAVYDLSVGVDVAATLGPVTNSDDLSANLAVGRGAVVVYRFATAAEAATGVRNLVITQQLAGLTAVSQAIKLVLAQTEQVRREFQDAVRALSESSIVPPRLRGPLWHRMHALKLRLLDRIRAAKSEAQDRATHLVRLVCLLADAKDDLNAHLFAIEGSGNVAVAAKVGGDFKILAGEASAEVENKTAMRFELAKRQLKVTRTFTAKGAVAGGLKFAKLGVEREVEVELEDTFARRADGALDRVDAKAKLSVDTLLQAEAEGAGESKQVIAAATESTKEITKELGAKASRKIAVGRKVSVELDRRGLDVELIGALLRKEWNVSTLAAKWLTLKVQDRYESSLAASLSFKQNGTGGGLGIETGWTDEGAELSSYLPAYECLQRVLGTDTPILTLSPELNRLTQASDAAQAMFASAMR